MAVSILAELVALRSVAPRVAQVGSETGATGHGGSGVGSASGGSSAEVTDPVCGMMVIAARARFWADHGDERYWFCAAGCETAFRREPHRYLSGGE